MTGPEGDENPKKGLLGLVGLTSKAGLGVDVWNGLILEGPLLLMKTSLEIGASEGPKLLLNGSGDPAVANGEAVGIRLKGVGVVLTNLMFCRLLNLVGFLFFLPFPLLRRMLDLTLGAFPSGLTSGPKLNLLFPANCLFCPPETKLNLDLSTFTLLPTLLLGLSLNRFLFFFSRAADVPGFTLLSLTYHPDLE